MRFNCREAGPYICSTHLTLLPNRDACEKQFLAATFGVFGHRWDPATVVEVLAKHPAVEMVVARGVLGGRDRRSSRTTPVDQLLVDLSMRRCGLGEWVKVDQVAAGRVALELAGCNDEVVSVALGLLERNFPGTPDELAAVAAAAAPATATLGDAAH